MLLWAWPLALLLLLLPQIGAAQWLQDDQPIMGTRVTVELWHTDEAQGRALIADVMADMREVEARFSPYIETSELARLNREAAKTSVQVSAQMWRLLKQAAEVSELSSGAFDITYASAGHLYDYRSGTRPSDVELRAALPAIDYRHVRLQPPDRVSFAHPNVTIDLGGIAKGYAVDRGIERLALAGVAHAMVAAGGDSRILGDRRGQPWTVGVQHPRERQQLVALLPLNDTAVSTSGDYERYFEADGQRFHHIISPTSGESARGLRSVTILGGRGVYTDALSTAVFVLGLERGLALINRLPDVSAIVVDARGQLRYSDDLAALD